MDLKERQLRLEAIVLGYEMAKEGKSIDSIKAELEQCRYERMRLAFWKRIKIVLDSVVIPIDVIEKEKEPLLFLRDLNAFSKRPRAVSQLENHFLPMRLDVTKPETIKDFLDLEELAFNTIVYHIQTEYIDKWEAYLASILKEGKETTLEHMPEHKLPTHKGNLLNSKNVGKTFVLIDVKEANWTSLQYLCKKPSLVAWETFVLSCLDSVLEKQEALLFAKSKGWRQAVLSEAVKGHDRLRNEISRMQQKLLIAGIHCLPKEEQKRVLVSGIEECFIECEKGQEPKFTLPAYIHVEILTLQKEDAWGFHVFNAEKQETVCKGIDNQKVLLDFMSQRAKKSG